MSLLSSLSTPELAQRCAEETNKFNLQREHDPQFCYELLRRALAERSSDAFVYVYQNYERSVMNWVLHHPGFARTGESAEYFANEAFRTFYFALRGPKFDRFPTVAPVLAYLKTCVHTAIAMYLRPLHASLVPIDSLPEQASETDLAKGIEIHDIWRRMQQLLPDERDQLLMRRVFVEGYRPRDISALYPTFWPTERQVSVDLYRIRRTLRSDPVLAGLLGLSLD